MPDSGNQSRVYSQLEIDSRLSVPRRRRLSPEQGRAIEMLGHAIEYLGDELALECVSLGLRETSGIHPQIAAIQILKERNREVYLICPEILSMRERVRSWMHLSKLRTNA